MKFADTTIAVTGANGFLGRAICAHLQACGATIRSLERHHGKQPNKFAFDLSSQMLDGNALKSPVHLVIHSAWDLTSSDIHQATRINVEGTKWLVEKCQEAKVERFIFISSLAAHIDAKSVYGQSKWAVETWLGAQPQADTFSTIIAPGTIIGPGGLFGKTRAMVKALPAIPVFYPTRPHRLQTIFIGDLCDAITKTIELGVTGKLLIAEETGIDFKNFYRGVAALEGRQPTLFPFPGNVALLGVLLLESMGLHPAITSNNLKGIKHLQHFDVSQTNLLLGCGPMGNYWQSLERLAMLENNPNAVKQIRRLAAAASV